MLELFPYDFFLFSHDRYLYWRVCSRYTRNVDQSTKRKLSIDYSSWISAEQIEPSHLPPFKTPISCTACRCYGNTTKRRDRDWRRTRRGTSVLGYTRFKCCKQPTPGWSSILLLGWGIFLLSKVIGIWLERKKRVRRFWLLQNTQYWPWLRNMSENDGTIQRAHLHVQCDSRQENSIAKGQW